MPKNTPRKRAGSGRAQQAPSVSPQQNQVTKQSKDTESRSFFEVLFDGSWADHLVTDAMADAFNKYFPLYPKFMTKSIKGLANFMFWHSLLLTFITPLTRYLDGIWKEEIPPYWLWNVIDKYILGGPGMKHNMTYIGTDKPHVDQAWIMHATAGMTWLVVAYLQICVVSKRFHTRFAWVSLATLIIHLGCALHILLVDQQQNLTLNKMVLGSLGVMTFVYMAVGTLAGIAGMMFGKNSVWPGPTWGDVHKDMMFRGWIWSISGAGPIRMVVTLGHPLGLGPIYCQEAHGSIASECLWPYLWRLTMIATWNLLMTGAYCKVRQSTHLTKTFLINVILHVITCLSFWVLSWWGDESMNWISSWTGYPTTDFSWIMTYIGIVLEMVQLSVYFPKQFVMWALFAPAVLVIFLVNTYLL